MALLLMPLAYLLNLHSIGYRTADATTAVAYAFRTGDLQDKGYLTGDTGLGFHQYNDCLILYQAIDQAAPRRVLAVSPLMGMQDAPCADLRALVAGGHPASQPYHRYLHGHTILARYALPHMSLYALRRAYKTLVTLLVGAGIGLALVQVGRARGDIGDHLFWLVLFATFARWFGLESFGQSLGHGPADAILLGFLLLLYGARCLGGLRGWQVAPAAAAFGIGTILFEFLTGGIPLGLAVLVGALPFALGSTDAILPSVLEGVVAFSTAVVLACAAKVALVWSVFGADGVRGIGRALELRVGLNQDQSEARDLGVVRLAKAGWHYVDALAAGMHLMSELALVAAVLCAMWSMPVLARAPDRTVQLKARLLLASNGVILLWIAGFSEHFVVHARFMDRMFVWFLVSGFCLFALAVWARLQSVVVGGVPPALGVRQAMHPARVARRATGPAAQSADVDAE